jgi:hypothetical protein
MAVSESEYAMIINRSKYEEKETIKIIWEFMGYYSSQWNQMNLNGSQ